LLLKKVAANLIKMQHLMNQSVSKVTFQWISKMKASILKGKMRNLCGLEKL